ncbi:MAG: rpsB, partial [Candidatus Berkelbacteria bacterium]|nr:rpsB [Candidatus Berkelbacteria bacterium]
VLEARKMKIPIIGICDTNANPDLVNYPIPANDDSEKTINLLLTKIEESLQGLKSDVKTEVKNEKQALKDGESDPKKEEIKATSPQATARSEGHREDK